ncbi:MAG: type IX secretion system membrane protein PorP/SprF [Leeuwenhoekiella sp.]
MYKTIIRYSVASIFLMSFYMGWSQQEPQYTQYMYNTMVINPAYVGTSGELNITGTYRSQWTGIDGSPETINLGVEAPLTDAMGLGVNLTRDALGPSNEYFLDGNFSYAIQLRRDVKLSFGIKGGLRVLNVDFNRGQFENQDDPLLMNDISNRYLGTIGAGAYMYSSKWYLGLSTPNFLSQQYYKDVAQSVRADEMNLYLIGGYVFDLSTDVKLKPAFLFDYVDGTPLNANLSANVLLYEKLSLGASWRIDAAVSALAGFQLLENLFVGYAYDYNTTDFRNFNDGSHEIVLKFSIFNTRGTTFSPRFF